MPQLTTLWPLFGLPLGCALLARQLIADPAGADLTSSRNLLAALLPIYMVHQFEEHGYDLQGERFAFQKHMARSLNYTDLDKFPATPAWVTAVNVAFAWTYGAISFYNADKDPLLSVAFNGFVLVNGILHIVTFLKEGKTYNPGLATAVTLFLPLTLYSYSKAAINNSQLVLSVVLGLAAHVAILGNFKMLEKGKVSQGASIAFWCGFGAALPFLYKTLASWLT